MSERSVPAPVRQIFTWEYAIHQYERHSMTRPRSYEIAAKVLAEIGKGKRDDGVILEIGCGTGNSTVEFMEANPNFSKFIGLDPSEGLITLAGYKFGKNNNIVPSLDIDPKVIEYIETQREIAAKFQNRNVSFVIGRAQALPFDSESIDKIYAASVMHWLAFADNDTEYTNVDHLSVSLREFARVLKRGGILVFDSSGLQFDFENRTIEDRQANSYHYSNHPFHDQFLVNLRTTLEGKGYKVPLSAKVDKYYHIFNLDLLKSKLGEVGLTLEQVDNEPYRLTFIPHTIERFLSGFTNAGRMRYFPTPELGAIPDDEKDLIINHTLQKTIAEHEDLLDSPIGELFASFVSEKIKFKSVV